MRNRSIRLASVFALSLAAVGLSGVLPQLTPTAQACGGYYDQNHEGIVKSVDRARGKVVITYRDAEQVETTATFKATTDEALAGLKAQDRVSFRFVYGRRGRLELSEIVVLPPVVSAQS
jgi:Cu/Ag efflux protein CusF